MAISWKILHMDRLVSADGRSNVVQNVFWYCCDTDANGNYGYCYGNTVFNVTGLSDNNFTEYTQLSEQQVIDWVKAELQEANELDIVENCVIDGMASGRFAQREQGIPW
jgi:hypothetical protein